MANNPLYNSSLANLYRSIGQERGVSPAFVNASIAQGIAESSLNPNARGDNGVAMGLHQWHPDRQKNLMALSQQMGLPPTDPRVQVNFWYNENKNSLGITDPRAANDAALASERPAGWKPGDPTGVPSYNKRLGDTLALMRMATGQPDPNNPRTFEALGNDEMANQPTQANVDLPEANSDVGNTVGPALTNLGSIVAGLDKSIGGQLMARNLSNVASNQLREQAINQKDNRWHFAGFTPNKSGALFSNGNQTVVRPLGEYGGDSQENLPASVLEYNYRKENPDYASYMDNKDKLEPSLSEDTRRMYAMRALKGDNLWTREIGGDKQGSVDKRAIDEEITKVASELKMDPNDLVKARTEQRYRQKVADQIARIDVNTEVAFNKINAAATNLLDTSKQYDRGDIRMLESLKQKWDEQTNNPKLQALKTAVDAFALDYATALNPQKTSPTVDDVRNARNKILTTMNQESLEAAVGIVQREIGSIRQNARKTHEQWFGKSVDEEKPSETGQPTSPQPKRLKWNPATGKLE